uniref:G_PROTEIN_RECEP_F1_2 domain-containing protein n=1 Tax=Steinernema glaseri TaxID=37863 RepID=A0A1I8AIA2_9BILA
MNETSNKTLTSEPDGHAITIFIIAYCEFAAIVLSLPLNCIIIFFSITKVPQSLARTYILNISVVTLFTVVYWILQDFVLRHLM